MLLRRSHSSSSSGPTSWWSLQSWERDFRRHWQFYVMALPAVISILVFSYGPMFGVVIAFLDYSPIRGIRGSEWVGLQNFQDAFDNPFFLPALKNTIIINVGKLVVGFPSAVLLALMLNEIRLTWFKRAVQTATMLPYFISWIVVASMFRNILAPTGIVNEILKEVFGVKPIFFLSDPDIFPRLIILQDTWKYVGYFGVIYLAAMTAIDPTLYEAAMVDGANRAQQIRYITLPGIAPTLVTMFVILVGYLIQGGLEQVFAMYNVSVYSTGDILDTFTYRLGLQQFKYGLATAVGLFQAAISLILVIFANSLVRHYNPDHRGLF
jgi:ABC-type polysaccharide transport system permease subunit